MIRIYHHRYHKFHLYIENNKSHYLKESMNQYRHIEKFRETCLCIKGEEEIINYKYLYNINYVIITLNKNKNKLKNINLFYYIILYINGRVFRNNKDK
jgi:hypothetical protein